MNTFPSIFSLVELVFSIFRRQIDGPSPSEMDIKVLHPTPTSQFIKTASFLRGKTEKTKAGKIEETQGAYFFYKK